MGRLVDSDYTEVEKVFIKMLFKIGKEIIESQDGYLDFNGSSFSSNDLYDLEDKLGIMDD